MRRKYFLIGILIIVAIAAIYMVIHHNRNARASSENPKPRLPDLVFAEGDNPEELFILSMHALGGLKSFDIKGKRVLVKPSISWDKSPEYGLNTNPELIYRIIDECYTAGAWEVYVIDHTIDDWRKCYKNSGIEKASKRAFGKILPANDKRFYKQIEGQDNNSGLYVHQLSKKCDFIINVPVLSVMKGGKVSAGITNLAGITWENRYTFEREQDGKWIEFFKTFKPDLTVIDVTSLNNSLIVSKDPLLAEAAAFNLVNIDVGYYNFLFSLEESGFGCVDTKKVTVEYIESK